MKRVKLITAILLVILAICVAPVNAKDNPNTITFDNQSGSPALVKLIGPTPQIVHAPNGQKRTVNVAAGEYYILARYGSSPERFRYSKGNTFSVRQTASQYSAVSITLHRVVGGNYPSRESSSEEFNKAIATQQIAETDKATVYQVQKRLKEDNHSGKVLTISFENPNALSSEAFKSLEKSVKLVDENGNAFFPFSVTHFKEFKGYDADNHLVQDLQNLYRLSFPVPSTCANYTVEWVGMDSFQACNPCKDCDKDPLAEVRKLTAKGRSQSFFWGNVK